MVSFVPGPVQVAISSRKVGLQYQEVQGMVAQDTRYAYHPVPTGTKLFDLVPDAWMITRTDRHSAVTGSLMPADSTTAEECIAYLVEHEGEHVSYRKLIESFAQEHGRWCQIPR